MSSPLPPTPSIRRDPQGSVPVILLQGEGGEIDGGQVGGVLGDLGEGAYDQMYMTRR